MIKNMIKDMYVSDEYLKNNPTWHAEDSLWKAQQIIKIIKKNEVVFNSICEIGCGAGEILVQLQKLVVKECKLTGYEISQSAYQICKEKENEKLKFEFKDFLEEESTFDLMLVIDVIEHIENYFDFLDKIRLKGKYKIFHIPLDLSVLNVLRKNALLKKRKKVGHVHYFTKELALQMLTDRGYEILDYFYTAGGVEIKSKNIKNRLLKIPRRILFAINKEFCVRVLGGYSFLVLTK